MGLLYFTNYKELIGGQKEKHGCLISTGYSWNESLKTCIREWELNQDERKAAKFAVSHMSFYTTINDVKTLDCYGCYDIEIKRNDNEEMIFIKIRNWRISEDSIY